MIFQFEDEQVVEVGVIPIDAFGAWPGLTTSRAVITRERHRHIVTNHPDVRSHIDEMILTINEPDEAHRYLSLDILELVRWQGVRHAWTVKIRVALDPYLSNSALTFYRTRRERIAKRGEQADSIWRRG